jgi:hypothetical protein
MPAGSHELPVVADSLKAIRIEMKKEGPPPSAGLKGHRAQETGARKMR